MLRLLAPRLWAGHLLAVVLVAVACALGVWQLGAWQAHRDAEAADLSARPAVPLTALMGPDDPFPGDRVGQPVEVEGTWVPDGSVLIQGRERDGDAGYWAATPVEIGGVGGAALYVVRGWAATPQDVPPPPTGPAALTAWLQPTEGTNDVDPDRSDDVLPQLRTADLVQHVDQDVYGAFGVAREPVGGMIAAELAQLPEASVSTGLKNFLYGIEWFVFGGFAGFIWWRWTRDELQRGEREEGAVPEEVTSSP
ncbi:SURF1 family protein [Nocardioides sp. SYSU DS0663]|uniref:SURF1 family protein n=1 Tax=Nocardioides sp. SYSU DS0663 TaxID=3416445 RepID=UPI003F4BBB2C